MAAMRTAVGLRLSFPTLRMLLAGLAIGLAAAGAVVALPATTLGSHVEPIRCDVADSEAIPAATEIEMLALINGARAAVGSAPVALSTHLMRAASWKVLDDSNAIWSASFGHTDTLGRRSFERAMDCGYRTASGAPLGGTGENISTGFSFGTAAGAHAGFMGSPGHRANLLRPNWVAAGIAFSDEGPSDKRWVLIFGSGEDENPLVLEPPAPLIPSPPPPMKTEVVLVGVSADGP